MAKEIQKKTKKKTQRTTTVKQQKSLPPRRAKTWQDRIVQAVWPQERDFFERPDRYRYVRKLLPNHGCVFCEAVQAELSADSLVLFKDQLVTVIMNKYPYNTGHLLIVPNSHTANLWDLSDEVSARLSLTIRFSLKTLKTALECDGFNIGLNHGKVAGAGIPDHLHWHVVPRWSGDTNFFPLIAETKVLPETLEQTYARLRPGFEGGL